MRELLLARSPTTPRRRSSCSPRSTCPDFETAGEMLALVADDDYAIYDGDDRRARRGWRRPVAEYREFIREEVVGHSNAKHTHGRRHARSWSARCRA